MGSDLDYNDNAWRREYKQEMHIDDEKHQLLCSSLWNLEIVAPMQCLGHILIESIDAWLTLKLK